jgi:hypothetical protein
MVNYFNVFLNKIYFEKQSLLYNIERATLVIPIGQTNLQNKNYLCSLKIVFLIRLFTNHTPFGW